MYRFGRIAIEIPGTRAHENPPIPACVRAAVARAIDFRAAASLEGGPLANEGRGAGGRGGYRRELALPIDEAAALSSSSLWSDANGHADDSPKIELNGTVRYRPDS